MDGLAETIILSWGWRRWAIAFGAGAASALAQPPFFAFPLLWLSLPVLVWLLDGSVGAGRSGRSARFLPAFAAGWWFGFGYFAAGLWWVGTAFLVDADVFGWMLPFAVLALPAGLGLFWGAGAAAAQLLWSDDWRRVFALAAGLGSAEWLRGLLFTGFPWNAIGYALTAGEVMIQSASLLGLYALNFVAVAVFAAPASMAPTAEDSRRGWTLPALSLALVAALAAYGGARLWSAETGFVDDLRIKIVQPAIDQAEKWRPENRGPIFRSYLDLSRRGEAALDGNTILVWPESAFPFALTEEPGALGAIADLLPQGAVLVTGALRPEPLPGDEQDVFNSVFVIDDTGEIRGAYDKVHLVPFGEYLPFQATLEALGLEQLTRLRGGFASGSRRRALSLPGGPDFVPLICYEIIFPGAVMPAGQRPGFLLNLTNDAWFGRTPGPYQHFHQARVRAVEEGLPLVRAANSGISAVTDSVGRVLISSELGAPAVIDAELPLAGPTTLAARLGRILAFTILISFIGVAVSRVFT
ncbi:MAG TPA: apolipoprotein N-acyltransferase [Afifellaceae bacterium]|nr:apolipoprotein N-acyltransferase [Afifellaceae bacterium]